MTEALEVSPRDYHKKLTLNREDIFDPESWLSTSTLKELRNCSLYRWRFAPKTFNGSAASDWGNVIDCLITTPDEINDVVHVGDVDDSPPMKPSHIDSESWKEIIDDHLDESREPSFVVLPFDSFKTKDARAARDEAISNGLTPITSGMASKIHYELPRIRKAREVAESGKIIFTEDQMVEARRAANVLVTDRIAGPIIKDAKKQVILLSKVKGINFKGLVDLVPSDEPCLYDLKTISDLSIGGISKAIQNFSYHVQAAIYLKLWNSLNPDDQRKRFRFIWQSSSPPYEVAVTELPAFDIEAGSEWAAFQINRLIEAQEKSRWPNIVGDKIAIIGRPGYAEFKDIEEMDELPTAPKS